MRSTMNIPYRTSRDYQLLKKLLDEGKEIVCFTDFPIDNRIFRDVCKARKIGEGRYSVTCRGCEYASFWEITITNGRLKMKCRWLI